LKKYAAVAIAITLGVLPLTGCSTSNSDPAVSSSTATPAAEATQPAEQTPEPEPEPDGTRARPLPFGTVNHIEDPSMWDFTVHAPNLDANAWVAQSDTYNESAAAGNVWVGANLSVVVRDIPEVAALTEPVSPGASLSPVFVGSSGTVYDFWTTGMPAMFAGTSWNLLPDVFVSPGTSWDQPFGIEVPAAEVDGGSFAVRHEVSGKVIFFG
jgi:hypothetical protein